MWAIISTVIWPEGIWAWRPQISGLEKAHVVIRLGRIALASVESAMHYTYLSRHVTQDVTEKYWMKLADS